MKQVLQNYKTGELKVDEVPLPKLKKDTILVKTKASFISAGTERTKIETARMNLLEKAISRLDMVKIVMNNIKQEGLVFTLKKAMNKLDASISLGYSCAGEVMETGEKVQGFFVGQKVACVGEKAATHSEINNVSYEFVVPMPEGIDYDEASFVGIGAIALNSVELSQARDGEFIAVIGLGLIGQMVAQILKAKGCRVVGVEIDQAKISLAKELGIDAAINPINYDLKTAVDGFSSNIGVDATIITAASKNNIPLEMAGKITRVKGRVVLVGAMPIIIPRKDYYEKELFFSISRGFGAGLYYKEEKDRQYAYNYKPVTIQENMKNFLSLLAEKKVAVKPLISHRFNISKARNAYQLIKDNKEKYLGVIFEYEQNPSLNKKISLSSKEVLKPVNIGFIGAGSFAQGYLLPILKKIKVVSLAGVSTASGINSKNVARKFGFKYCTTDHKQLLDDNDINCIFITTRHNLHAELVIQAIERGKNVFVEKPLCMNLSELRDISRALKQESLLMVGFNRRFSPFSREVKSFFKDRFTPLVINYRINAGHLPLEHWIYDPKEGGGRIISEVCHFIDLLQYFTQATPVEVFATSTTLIGKDNSKVDSVVITLKFSDKSIATINYNSVGDIAYPRERVEVFGENSIAVIDNFRKATFSRSSVSYNLRRIGRDMGYKEELRVFVESLSESKLGPISFENIALTTLVTFKILESLQKNIPIKIDKSELRNF